MPFLIFDFPKKREYAILVKVGVCRVEDYVGRKCSDYGRKKTPYTKTEKIYSCNVGDSVVASRGFMYCHVGADWPYE